MSGYIRIRSIVGIIVGVGVEGGHGRNRRFGNSYNKGLLI